MKSKTTATSSKAGQAGSIRRRKKPDLLPTMPLDILYEIFGELHPKDLVYLSRANKLFRETLIADNMRNIWKRARENSGAPDCPSGMKEYHWAELLFMPECQLCGKRNNRTNVDFLIRRRLCHSCRKANLVLLSKFKGEVSETVLDHLPYTTSIKNGDTGDPEQLSSHRKRHFFQPDIKPMVSKMIQLRRAAASSPEGKIEFENYKKTKRELIQSMHLTVDDHQKWLRELSNNQGQDDRSILDARCDAINAKLSDLGYTRDDIYGVKRHAEYLRKAPLTERMWQRIQPILEAEIQNLRQKEVERKLSRFHTSRRDIVKLLYDVYKLTVPPIEWKRLPRVVDMCDIPAFAELVKAPPTTMVTADDFQPAMEMLPDLLREYQNTQLAKYRSQLDLSATKNSRGPSSNDESNVSPPTNSLVDPLDRATSVFICDPSPEPDRKYYEEPNFPHGSHFCMVGIDKLLSHHCARPRAGLSGYGSFMRYPPAKGDVQPEKTFTIEGSKVARKLVALAGLNPDTALAADMDLLDLRFRCDYCKGRPGTYYSDNSFIFSWRVAVNHGLGDKLDEIESRDVDEVVPKNPWSIVSGAEAVKSKEDELIGDQWEKPIWSCHHCTAFCTEFQEPEVVIQHVKSEHDIENPKRFEDLFVLNRRNKIYYTGRQTKAFSLD